MTLERTFVAIKPDGVQRGLISEVLGRFETGVSFKNEIGGGTRAFKSCARLREIEIGRKLKNLRNQRLRNHASDAKYFFGFFTPRKPNLRGPEDAVGFEKIRQSGRF